MPTRLLTLIVVLAMVLAACTGAGGTSSEGESDGAGAATSQGSEGDAAAAGSADQEYERSETLYTSGTQWGPPANWNPFMDWAYATGTNGLVYETLFIYDPLTDEYTPWLAEGGDWIDDSTYEATLRDGVTWTDGEELTADDVVFSFELSQDAAVPQAPLWDALDSVEADGSTIRFTFSEPLYQEWANYLYTYPIVPEHIWADMDAEAVASGANEQPVGSGPYVYDTHSDSRMVWVRNDDWWGTEAMDMEMVPKRIVDIVNSDNNTALGLMLQGQLDLSNNFLPGIASLVGGVGGYTVKTFYPDAPYMIAANTAWLVTNNTEAPLDDPEFRRALATSINVDQIVDRVYGNIVTKADPTGLLPIWDEYIDQGVVDELGFSYDTGKARQILADAGYEDTDGDGLVETPDGEKIDLTIQVPNGWTDWMESVRVVSSSAKEAGINVTPDFPDYNAYVDGRNSGNFDMLIVNEEQISNTPWIYYDWMYRQPITDTMTAGNYGRYENQQAYDLTRDLDKTPVDDKDAMRKVISDMQRIHLQDMPVIPLWYNGLWAQYSDQVWSGWPEAGSDNETLPAMWRGYVHMSGIRMLANLEPTPPAEEG